MMRISLGNGFRTGLFCVLAAALFLTVPGAKANAEDTVLVPASGGLGAKLPDIAVRFTRALLQVARKNGVNPELTDASRDDVFAVAGCNSDDDPCHQAVLRTLGAERLLLIHVVPGSGTTIADVELVMASRGKKTARLDLALTSSSTERLVEEFIAKSPALFGSSTEATSSSQPTGSGIDPNAGSLENGEGLEFSGPTVPEDGGRPNAGRRKIGSRHPGPLDPNESNTTSLPTELETTPPSSTPNDGGGYDFARVQPLSWAVGGAGAGLVLTSFIFYGLAGSKQNDVNSARANTAADLERIMDLEASGKTLNTVGNTAFFLGLVGLGVGGYLIYRDAKISASETSVTIAPIPLADGFAIGFEVRR